MNHPRSRSAFVAATLTTFAAVGTGLGGCTSFSPTVEGRMTSSVPMTDAPRVHVRSINGGIRVIRTDEPTMSVEAKVRARNTDRLDAVRIVTERGDDGSYDISLAWPDDERLNNEGADLSITLPDASELRLESSNGAFNIEGFDAAVFARTSLGSIRVIGPARSVDVVTSNGTINIEGATGDVLARSSNGWIRVTLDPESPGPVEATTSNGSITLGAGPSFDSEIEMWTSRGSLRVDGFESIGPPSFLESRRNYMRLGFGDATHKSTLRTTNGNVTVRPL